MNKVTSKTLYTCPMDPDVISEKPGRCPKCGMNLVALDQSEHAGHQDHGSMEQDFKRRFFLTLPLVLLTMLLSQNIQMWLGISIQFPGQNWLLFIFGTIIFFIGGVPFFKAAKGEIVSKNFGMMTLVSLAIIVGYSFSVAATFLFPGESLYWEISTLISVFLLGHWLEMRAVRGTTGALVELTKLIPQQAHLIKDGIVSDVQTNLLQVGDVVLIKPGEKIPVDGVVIEGISSVNESMITGESRPVLKNKDDAVIGGTINQDGSLTIKVAKTGENTTVSQIIKLIQEAQSTKPSVQNLADQAARVLTLVAILAGVSAFIYWSLISPHGVVFAATLAVAAIVVACPHALGLAIPTVTTITSTLAAQNGILIKDMQGLESAKNIDYVVFDKTGTLTKGEFGVVDIITRPNAKEKEILKLAAAVETNSQHSIALGVVNEAKRRDIKIPSIKDFTSYPGKGAFATVDNKRVVIGNTALLKQFHIEDINFSVEKARSTNTPVYVAVNGNLMGVIFLADIIRDESAQAVQRLHQMGVKTAMLTGDVKAVAEEVGRKLKIDRIFAEVLPEEKVDQIKKLQQEDQVTAMVGDGINDAPSLIQSNVGIAIGAGTDVAVESADIVLIKNNPMDVVKIIILSKKTNTKMVQNLIWATGYNIFAIPIAAGVLYPSFGILLRPEWAALLMSLSSIIVVINALILRKTSLEL